MDAYYHVSGRCKKNEMVLLKDIKYGSYDDENTWFYRIHGLIRYPNTAISAGTDDENFIVLKYHVS
jgi:hypothetical protein